MHNFVVVLIVSLLIIYMLDISFDCLLCNFVPIGWVSWRHLYFFTSNTTCNLVTRSFYNILRKLLVLDDTQLRQRIGSTTHFLANIISIHQHVLPFCFNKKNHLNNLLPWRNSSCLCGITSAKGKVMVDSVAGAWRVASLRFFVQKLS